MNSFFLEIWMMEISVELPQKLKIEFKSDPAIPLLVYTQYHQSQLSIETPADSCLS
jgi:hypothetical protein